jgi:hypothetical protein
MPRDADILARFGRELLGAQDRRGMWRPALRCQQALVLRGVAPARALQMVAAMQAVHNGLRHAAPTPPAPGFEGGR